jgi:hypothetical protein
MGLHSHFMKSECGGIDRVERVERGEILTPSLTKGFG